MIYKLGIFGKQKIGDRVSLSLQKVSSQGLKAWTVKNTWQFKEDALTF